MRFFMCVEKVCKFHLKKNISPFALSLDGQPKKQKRNKKKKKKGKNFLLYLEVKLIFLRQELNRNYFLSFPELIARKRSLFQIWHFTDARCVFTGLCLNIFRTKSHKSIKLVYTTKVEQLHHQYYYVIKMRRVLTLFIPWKKVPLFDPSTPSSTNTLPSSSQARQEF